MNASTLPGLIGHVVVMPDVHQGYGFPIGGVAATRLPDGVISPGGIGYDINCGVRMLSTAISLEESESYIEELAAALYANCPSGVGTKGKFRLSEKNLNDVCRLGSEWALKNGYATAEDLACTEEGGRVQGADPGVVSKRAKERGIPQMGSLGAGNHFLEIDLVEAVFHPQAAVAMGLREGHLAVQIHCGSRGFGHQICSDYVRELQVAVQRYGIQLPDRELVCAPLDSPEGMRYLSAMRCAANYAFCNRQVLASFARHSFEQVLAGKVHDWELYPVYDIAHNIGKIEQHEVNGKVVQVCVHRKGATRAFGPGFDGLPEHYRALGQPVLVPGSMGTASWVLLGTEKSMAISFGSSCHGAGRVLSRKRAKRDIRGDKLKMDLEAKGIHIFAGSMPGLAEEAPQAYKDVDAVVNVVSQAGIAKKVARLLPLAVIKG
jgi:tRNA-splicing ligase RtcB